MRAEWSALDCAREGDCARLAKALDEGWSPNGPVDQMGYDALMLAIEGRSRACVEALLDAGCSLEHRTRGGSTALMVAAVGGDPAICAMLLAAGARWDQAGGGGVGPLMLACRSGSIECARLLVDAGADIEARDGNGRTALIHSAMFGSLAGVDFLLGLGCGLEARDARGLRAQDWALEDGGGEECKACGRLIQAHGERVLLGKAIAEQGVCAKKRRM